MEIKEAAELLLNTADEMGVAMNAGHPETAKAEAIETAQKILAAFPAELKDTPGEPPTG